MVRRWAVRGLVGAILGFGGFDAMVVLNVYLCVDIDGRLFEDVDVEG